MAAAFGRTRRRALSSPWLVQLMRLRFEKLHIAGLTGQWLPIHAAFVIGKN
jgi:hypothetical protein